MRPPRPFPKPPPRPKPFGWDYEYQTVNERRAAVGLPLLDEMPPLTSTGSLRRSPPPEPPDPPPVPLDAIDNGISFPSRIGRVPLWPRTRKCPNRLCRKTIPRLAMFCPRCGTMKSPRASNWPEHFAVLIYSILVAVLAVLVAIRH